MTTPLNNLSKVLYVSLDNFYFSNNTLVELAEKFASHGGTHLFLDEVHKYENWSKEIKNLYDDFPELHIAFTGSSLLEILNGRADLSRRTLVYELTGLSFREYLSLIKAQDFPIFTLEEILENNEQISAEEESDFFVDSKYTFEAGGKNKKRKQIQAVPDSYIIADDIEFGTDRRIPIWLLGFMY